VDAWGKGCRLGVSKKGRIEKGKITDSVWKKPPLHTEGGPAGGKKKRGGDLRRKGKEWVPNPVKKNIHNAYPLSPQGG